LIGVKPREYRVNTSVVGVSPPFTGANAPVTGTLFPVIGANVRDTGAFSLVNLAKVSGIIWITAAFYYFITFLVARQAWKEGNIEIQTSFL
jgi:energy-converting hydrogenase Eha subunit G